MRCAVFGAEDAYTPSIECGDGVGLQDSKNAIENKNKEDKAS